MLEPVSHCLQWKIDTVYQEDYTGLLNATEIGVRVTRDPLNIHNLTSKFPTYLHEAIEEVKWSSNYMYCLTNDYHH